VRKLFILSPVTGGDGLVTVRDIEDRPPPSKGQTPGEIDPKGVK
jgi:hypothetical protein